MKVIGVLSIFCASVAKQEISVFKLLDAAPLDNEPRGRIAAAAVKKFYPNYINCEQKWVRVAFEMKPSSWLKGEEAARKEERTVSSN